MIIDTVFVLAFALVIQGDTEIDTKAYTFQTRAACRSAKAELYTGAQRYFTKNKDKEEKQLVYVSDCEAVPVEKFVNQGR